ncbi:MAG: hypothetical protein WDA72_04125 [Desulfomonilia bacterium]|jgi:hypothetical protein|nr:hypothetical protein [Deltaproteobacteria bacterium]
MNNYSYLFFALICNLACMSPAAHISEDGDRITMTSGGYELTAHAVAGVDQSYLLMAWDASESDGFSDAAITCIPFDRTDVSQVQRGDFTQDKNLKKGEISQGAMDIRLIMTNGSCRRVLKKMQGLCSGPDNPVFRVVGREVQIGQATYRNMPTPFGNPPATVILADTIELEQARHTPTEIAALQSGH